MMRRTLWALLLLAGCCLSLAAMPATAALLLEENFDYPAGTLLTATGNWTAHSGGGTQPIDVAGFGLTYAGYASSGIGNAAQVDNNGEDDNRTFALQSSGAVYYGFMLSSSSPIAGYFAHLIQTGTTFGARIFAQPSGGGMQLGISNTSSSPAYAAGTYALSTTHLVVVKFDFTTQLASLWVNPALGGAEPAADAVSPAAATGFSAGAVALRQYSTTQNFTIDGIRVGTTWEDVTASGSTPTGACCFADGSCTVLSATDCAAQSGSYQGDGSGCSPNPCPQPAAACCFADGTCQTLVEADCATAGGTFQGNGSACSPNPCPQPGQGACCFADGSCTFGTASACAAQGGTYFGDGSLCDPNPCPQPATGACCFTNGSCSVLFPADCATQGGTYQGDNTLCSPNPCPFPQVTLCDVAADNADGTPVLLNQYVEFNGIAHSASGTWSPTIQQFEVSDGVCCVSVFGGALNPMVAVGDHVLVRGTVTQYRGLTEVASPDLQVTVLSSGNPVYGPGVVTTGDLGGAGGEQYEACLIQINCATITSGTWPAAGQSANLTINDGSGAVTLRIDGDTNIDGSPAPTGPINIVGVAYQFTNNVPPGFTGYQILPRSLADITPCVAPGACCFADGTCQTLVEAECLAAGGAFHGGACDPNPCPQPGTGACCFTSGVCTVLTGAQCATQGGTYQGDNTSCTPNPCPQPVLPICDVAADNLDGTPVLLNQVVTVEGIAHVNSGVWSTSTQQFEISDGSCCVSVFGGAISPVVQAGDLVRVTGTVIQYSGLTEISSPLSVTILSSGNPVYGPGTITTGELGTNGEPYEACLIRINCATITSGVWPIAGQNANLTINDGSGPVTLRIDKDTNIDGTPAPTGPIDIVGVAYQFTSSVPPYFTGYQILPRSLTDITPCSTPQPAACCFPDGLCTFVLETECAAAGGAWQGTGTVCDPNPCPLPYGACCFPNGACAVLVPEECATLGGTYLSGPCDPNPCPQPPGACCFADGSCQYLTQSDCGVLAGQWQGMGTNCDPNPCPAPNGACCLADGNCVVTTEAQCPTGLWFIFGACEPNPCPQPTGACCFPDGSCIVTLAADCQTGDWRVFLTCDPNPCPPPPVVGACCFEDGTCQVVTEAACLDAQGQWFGATYPDCDPNPCEPVPVERTSWGRIKGMYRQ